MTTQTTQTTMTEDMIYEHKDNKNMSKEIAKKEQAISFEGWKATRKNFIDNIQTIMVAGKDYHDLNFRGKDVRVLAKGGAEKVASAFGWKATFVKDTETIEMLGAQAGMLAYVCKLTDKKDQFIGEGRGARKLSQDNGDPNKTIKMAQKSAFIDAVLRTSGLSDLFTQDLETEPEAREVRGAEIVPRVIEVEPEVPNKKNIIASYLKTLGKLAKSKKETDANVLSLTGLEMVESNYDEIAVRLSALLSESNGEN